MIRAMRVMAVEAVLRYWRMLEYEWPAFLGVATEACFVDRIGLQHRLGDSSVRVMAIRARNLAFRQRHVRTAIELRHDILMAARAHLIDGAFGQYAFRRVTYHRVVAIRTRHATCFVH